MWTLSLFFRVYRKGPHIKFYFRLNPSYKETYWITNRHTCCFKSLKQCFRRISFNCRSSCPEVFCRKGVLRNFAKFTGKHLFQSLFSNKSAGFRPATLLIKRLFQILRNLEEHLLLQNTSGSCFFNYKNSISLKFITRRTNQWK